MTARVAAGDTATCPAQECSECGNNSNRLDGKGVMDHGMRIKVRSKEDNGKKNGNEEDNEKK